MGYKEMEWKCADGTRMFACEWSPDQPEEARAVVGIVHGMGEHMGRYSHVAEMLNAEGYMVIGFDQRGHGRTEGKRGHVPAYVGLLEGVDLLIAEARTKYPGIPFFLYGHSMGGNVTLNYLLRKQPKIAGAIVTGPWLKLAFKPPSLQAAIGRIIERIYPKYTNSRPMVAEHLTSDPAMIERYVNDKLGHGQITAKYYFGVHRAGNWALEHANDLKVPLLIMHGGDDRVTSIHASKQFADQTKALSRWHEWPGYKHELHNDIGREDVFAVIRTWLNEQLAGKDPAV
ncbi:alpha/beta hydrolase [Cohnella silvisoli]|uniref:Alpha/beta hydrolase n=1 Tax=Cohnella silvisoli TaxID=2873699 RepID=A0ABV1L1E5_9BACL|nr:alpha/beta hydrolase [Cohnella silvisoli]MCD9025497.1 lysophospholipase [Cohnella silvisoli]